MSDIVHESFGCHSWINFSPKSTDNNVSEKFFILDFSLLISNRSQREILPYFLNSEFL